MQKCFKLAALTGALLMVSGGSAIAASHDLVFDGWTVTNGTIDVTGGGSGTSVCSTGAYDCSTVASGDGFTQTQVTAVPNTPGAVSGESYIMTIVTDQNATGAPGAGDLGFYDVSYVKMKLSLGGGTTPNNNENGISAQQVISETTTAPGGGSGTSFDSTTDINTGWSVAATPVAISQSLMDNGDTTTQGDNFDSTFEYASQNDEVTGIRNGFEMSIGQVAGLASPGDQTSDQDVQVFSLRQRQGSLQTSPSAVDLAGKTVSWLAGENIKAIWIGQTINLGGSTPQNGSLGSQFGYLSFENVSDPAVGRASEFGFAASNAESAWVWDPAFNIGTGSGTPNICDPSGATVCPITP